MTIALVDCNNFFVSCERLFRPDIENRPAVVLSNNDGCIISRSNEAKALGIKMGEPYFKVKGLLRRHNVHVFSCNHTLYGDISRRVDETLETFSGTIENYSIDESFLDLSGIRTPGLHAQDIRRTVRQWTGIPTCVGIGPTKTIAKLANHCAKKMPDLSGVCDLSAPEFRVAVMAKTDIGDIWGIGSSSAEKLRAQGLCSALSFAQAPLPRIRALLQVQGARLHQELNGIPCFGLDAFPDARKGVHVTRSFGRPVLAMDELAEALSTFAARAGEKLRQEKQETRHVTAFIRTSRHADGDFYCNSLSYTFPSPTDSTFEISRAALALLRQMYRSGPKYAKAGIYLSDLTPGGTVPRDLLTWERNSASTRIMRALDRVNGIFGAGTLKPARLAVAQGSERRNWHPRKEQRSPNYATQWGEFLTVR